MVATASFHVQALHLLVEALAGDAEATGPKSDHIGGQREAHVSVAIVEAEHRDPIRHRVVSSEFEDGVPLGSVGGLDGSYLE